MGGADQWGELKKLVAGDAEWGDLFGWSVAIDGDYALIGAPHKSGAYYSSGAAYVFFRDQGGTDNWGEVKKITADDPHLNQELGRDVAIDGDLVIAGSSGAAYLYSRQDDWGQIKKLVGSDTQSGDDFGNAVAISGDCAAGGAHNKSGAGENRGAAYIFNRDQGGSGNWGEIKKITASDAHDMDEFGYSVAIHGDYALVGAPYAADLFNSQGAAYFYSRNQGGANAWGELKKVMASDTEDGDVFGSSVGIAGDYAIAGAPFEDGPGEDRGAAYLFKKDLQ
jgi:hypothetical protein